MKYKMPDLSVYYISSHIQQSINSALKVLEDPENHPARVALFEDMRDGMPTQELMEKHKYSGQAIKYYRVALKHLYYIPEGPRTQFYTSEFKRLVVGEYKRRVNINKGAQIRVVEAINRDHGTNLTLSTIKGWVGESRHRDAVVSKYGHKVPGWKYRKLERNIRKLELAIQSFSDSMVQYDRIDLSSLSWDKGAFNSAVQHIRNEFKKTGIKEVPHGTQIKNNTGEIGALQEAAISEEFEGEMGGHPAREVRSGSCWADYCQPPGS